MLLFVAVIADDVSAIVCGSTVSFLVMSDVSVFTFSISFDYCQAKLFFSMPTCHMPIFLVVSCIN